MKTLKIAAIVLAVATLAVFGGESSDPVPFSLLNTNKSGYFVTKDIANAASTKIFKAGLHAGWIAGSRGMSLDEAEVAASAYESENEKLMAAWHDQLRSMPARSLIATSHRSAGSTFLEHGSVQTAGLSAHSQELKVITRICSVSNQTYVVTYEYQSGYGSIPAIEGAQVHYDCTVRVYRAQLVGTNWQGVVTPNGCFEDQPTDMVRKALAQ